MQVYGYVSSHTSGGHSSVTLVHGVCFLPEFVVLPWSLCFNTSQVPSIPLLIRLRILCIFWQYHGSFSLRHWLQQSDWLPTLEATLALDEESVRRVGDDSVGGPAVSRQLRLIRILMRDLLIGVCFYLQ